MKSMAFDLRVLAICIIVSAAFGALAGFFASHIPQSQQQLIGEFYATENAATMSPVDYLDSMQGNGTGVIIVDLRAQSLYATSHLVGAINIPAENLTAEQLVAAFRALPPGRPVVTYCYSMVCTLSQGVGLVLSQNGIYVKHLTAGWLEIQSEYPGYIIRGPEPGTLEQVPANANTTCSSTTNSTFTC